MRFPTFTTKQMACLPAQDNANCIDKYVFYNRKKKKAMKGVCAHPSTQHTHTNAGERKEKAVKNMAYNKNAARCSQQYRFLANICTKEPLSSACTQRHGEAKRKKGKVSVQNGISSAKAKWDKFS